MLYTSIFKISILFLIPTASKPLAIRKKHSRLLININICPVILKIVIATTKTEQLGILLNNKPTIKVPLEAQQLKKQGLKAANQVKAD